ncbi:permease [Clostridiales bacterium PH28_bin88]|nr:permease [Clostridiales bacterium PH28_bin88]
MKEYQKLLLIVGVFLGAYYVPFNSPQVSGAILESFAMLQEYARLHVLTCLVPAFFIAGAISNFVSQGAVLKYMGHEAKSWMAYSVASVSGTILAVCSCTVLPLFAGIYKRGAGLGPAIAFLYSGPAINVLAIILTARILGWHLGLARAVGAVLFSVVIGLVMALLFRNEEASRFTNAHVAVATEDGGRNLGQTGLYFLSLVLILIFASWGKPSHPVGFWNAVFGIKWYLAGFFILLMGLMLLKWFKKEEVTSWVEATWGFAKQILPLLFAGVLTAGLLMGRPGSNAGLIPSEYVAALVGGNSLFANFFASVVGAFMYFATLTEVPILQGLIGSGMGQGPALALLLAGPALSLPNMLVIRSVLGTKKTVVYVSLVIVMATITGMIYGNLVTI